MVNKKRVFRKIGSVFKKSLLAPSLIGGALLTQALMIPTATAFTTLETPVQYIPLTGPLAKGESEMSALTWCDDTLVIFPQYPDFQGRKNASVYTLKKSDILDFLRNQNSISITAEPSTDVKTNNFGIAKNTFTALTPKALKVKGNKLLRSASGYEGIEAAVCENNQLTLALELDRLGGSEATQLVKAHLEDNKLVIDALGQTLPSPSGIGNKGNEALVKTANGLLSIHEVNDFEVMNNDPIAFYLESFDANYTEIPFVNLSYRITDATTLDAENKFWVINYQYQGDKTLSKTNDDYGKKYGKGLSQQKRNYVERLVELQLTEHGVIFTETPPIQLQLTGKDGRNWEGIVRLDDIGFLLVTDKHPQSLLGFVPFNKDLNH